MAKQYRKIVHIVEALKWDGRQRDMFDFLTGTTDQVMTYRGDHFHIEFDNGPCQLGSLIIHTPEGNLKANLGDYVIKGISGEFYPCKPHIFEESYEEVEPENALKEESPCTTSRTPV